MREREGGGERERGREREVKDGMKILRVFLKLQSDLVKWPQYLLTAERERGGGGGEKGGWTERETERKLRPLTKGLTKVWQRPRV